MERGIDWEIRRLGGLVGPLHRRGHSNHGAENHRPQNENTARTNFHGYMV